MRRDQGLARVAVAGAGAALLVIVATTVPLVTGAPRSTTADLVVIVGLGAASTRLAAAGRDATAVAMLLAAAVWTLTGIATSLPEPVGSPMSRLVLVPHAILVVVLALALADRRRVAGSVVLAAVAALAAGAGLEVPVLALLGLALLVAVTPAKVGSPADVRAATIALAVALVLVDPRVLGDALDPRSLATAVDLLLLGIAATAIWRTTSDPTRRLDMASAERGGDEVGAWLARVLGVPPPQVAFPSDRGAVDSAGQAASYPRDAVPLIGQVGVVAYVSPPVPVGAAVREPLLATVGRLGEIARLRAKCRAQAEAVVASRGRLQAAADEESRRASNGNLDATLAGPARPGRTPCSPRRRTRCSPRGSRTCEGSCSVTHGDSTLWQDALLPMPSRPTAPVGCGWRSLELSETWGPRRRRRGGTSPPRASPMPPSMRRVRRSAWRSPARPTRCAS